MNAIMTGQQKIDGMRKILKKLKKNTL